MFHITGDPHGNFSSIKIMIESSKILENDTTVILGDSGLNYHYPNTDYKKNLNKYNVDFFVIHGNHDGLRPDKLNSYQEVEYFGGIAYQEKEFKNIVYAKFGEIYNFPDCNNEIKKCIVLDGAYSVDKYYRLNSGKNWWNDEQPTNEMKDEAIKNLEKENWEIDYVFSHTCPYDYMPRELFLSVIDETTVDNTLELWLQFIYNNLKLNNIWYFGHFHSYKIINEKMVLMYHNVLQLGKI